MEVQCTGISYSETGYFSKLVTDYLERNAQLQPFYLHTPDLDGIRNAIVARQQFPQQRDALVQQLRAQYAGLAVHENTEANIALLEQDNVFTITTAHQPNIFTGPLYFIYKILHTIKLAHYLHQQLPEYNFVPVYYMGSEDADLEEIGTISVDGVPYQWQTNQTGAVGRMKVDNAFLQLIATMQGQLGVLLHGQDLVAIYRKCYTKGKSIQQATLELVNDLFGEFGLVVLVPDNRALKQLFIPVLEKELMTGFSYKAVNATIAALDAANYKVQTGGREINLFYLTEGKRSRIEKKDGQYTIEGTNLSFTEAEIIEDLRNQPERFSPNVILRGVFQETVLPNIAFIGGGGELAYWLELKNVFAAAGVPYPVLLLRNSFLVVEEKWARKASALGISTWEMFQPLHALMALLVERKHGKKAILNGELDKAEALYNQVASLASSVDTTLLQHVAAIKAKAVKHLKELEKKMLRAEKRKLEAEERQLTAVRAALFPRNSLQERVDNIGYLYGVYGPELIPMLYNNSPAIDPVFTILEISSTE